MTSPASSISSTGAWVGRVNPVTPITFSALVKTPPNAQQVTTVFRLVDVTLGVVVMSTRASSSSGFVSVSGPDLSDGHRYAWSVYATDGVSRSATARGVPFGADTTSPVIRRVTSDDYPEDGSGRTTTLHAGMPGTFVVTVNDVLPTQGRRSGIAYTAWSLNQELGSGGPPRESSTSGSVAGSTAVLTITPSRWGTNILYLRTEDNAGNVTQTRRYTFYVPS